MKAWIELTTRLSFLIIVEELFRNKWFGYLNEVYGMTTHIIPDELLMLLGIFQGVISITALSLYITMVSKRVVRLPVDA